jgi:hypothetical protein
MDLNDYIIKLNNANEDINKIKERMATNIGDDDLKRYFGESINDHIIKYSDLVKYKNIEELLPSHRSYKIILIEDKINSGHWVLLIRFNNEIEFFNSYGLKPSSELDFIGHIQNWFLGQDIKHLNILLNKARNKFKIIYNKKRFQKLKNGINTCGRWVILRLIMLLFFNMNLYDFNKFIDKLKQQYNYPTDVIVSMLIV